MSFMRSAQETVTLPHPFEPDVEIERQMGNKNFTSAVLEKCNGTEGIRCANGTITQGGLGQLAAEYTAWVGASEDILYFIFPIMLAWGILSGLVNLIVLLRQVSVSVDSYLIGFVIANILLLVCGGVLKIEEYLGHQNWYQEMYGHVKSINDWLWYTSLWLMLVMVLEKSSVVTQKHQKSVCSPLQAFIVSLMVYIVTAISALPQLWEYQATQTFDYLSNTSIVMSQQSEMAENPAFKLMYFWYVVTITVFLPLPLLTVLVGILVRGMRYAQHCRRHMPTSHGSGNIMNKKVTEEIHLLRFFIVLVLLYILLTAPFTFLNLVDHLYPHWDWPLDSIFPGLYCIFQFMFYFYFTIPFFLLASYNDKFRHSLMKTCCCCCCREVDFTELKPEP